MQLVDAVDAKLVVFDGMNAKPPGLHRSDPKLPKLPELPKLTGGATPSVTKAKEPHGQTKSAVCKSALTAPAVTPQGLPPRFAPVSTSQQSQSTAQVHADGFESAFKSLSSEKCLPNVDPGAQAESSILGALGQDSSAWKPCHWASDALFADKVPGAPKILAPGSRAPTGAQSATIQIQQHCFQIGALLNSMLT